MVAFMCFSTNVPSEALINVIPFIHKWFHCRWQYKWQLNISILLKYTKTGKGSNPEANGSVNQSELQLLFGMFAKLFCIKRKYRLSITIVAFVSKGPRPPHLQAYPSLSLTHTYFREHWTKFPTSLVPFSTKVAYIMLTLLCTFPVIHSALLFPLTRKVLRLYKHGVKEPCDNCCVSVPDTTSYRALPHRNKCHKATATETTSNNLHATFFIF